MEDSELERLALLTEEAAEVQQMAMKIVRHGYSSHNPFDQTKTSNRKLLEKEIGHLLFAVNLMIDCHDLSRSAIGQFEEQKRDTVQQYLHHNIARP